MKLTRERIVEEALALLNEGGIGAVSLRRVAARVSARAPSLALHVGDKQQLLTAMAQLAFDRCLARVPECATWQRWLEVFGLELWREQSRLRDAARLIALAAPDREQLERMTERVVRPLVALGLAHDEAIWMQASVQALTTGWTTFAQGADAANFASIVDLEQAVADSLAALVRGFEVRPPADS